VYAKYSRGHVTLATPLSEIVYYKRVERAKQKLCTNLELSGFNNFRDIVECMPNFPGVTLPRPRPLSEILYSILMGRAKFKLYKSIELSGSTSFGGILEGMPKILGAT